jgi:large subunit ribosomal protein L3
MLGRKVGMTQIYETDGTAVPITVLECGPCTVLQVRTADRDGYHAVQLGFADKKRKNATQAERGHAKKANAEPKRFVREIRQSGPTDVAEGQTLTVDLFDAIPRVDVIGTSKGRGFSGVMKRHGFKGLRATHGVKRMHRHPGSSGPSADPAHTRKGIRKPGALSRMSTCRGRREGRDRLSRQRVRHGCSMADVNVSRPAAVRRWTTEAPVPARMRRRRCQRAGGGSR